MTGVSRTMWTDLEGSIWNLMWPQARGVIPTVGLQVRERVLDATDEVFRPVEDAVRRHRKK